MTRSSDMPDMLLQVCSFLLWLWAPLGGASLGCLSDMLLVPMWQFPCQHMRYASPVYLFVCLVLCVFTFFVVCTPAAAMPQLWSLLVALTGSMLILQ